MDGTNEAGNSSGQKGVELNCALPSIELAAGGAEYILELNFFSLKFLPQATPVWRLKMDVGKPSVEVTAKTATQYKNLIAFQKPHPEVDDWQ